MFTVRSAEPGDVTAMAELFREMDEFYGETATESVDAKVHQTNSVLFADPPLAYAILACDGSNLVGMAAYSFLWPAALTAKSLYLKDLIRLEELPQTRHRQTPDGTSIQSGHGH